MVIYSRILIRDFKNLCVCGGGAACVCQGTGVYVKGQMLGVSPPCFEAEPLSLLPHCVYKLVLRSPPSILLWEDWDYRCELAHLAF